MIFKKIPVWAVVLFILVVIVAVALWLRIALPYNQVFVGEWVKLTGVDTYYYMRLVDNLLQHFPNLTQFDPYYIFPGGIDTGREPNFFTYLIAGIVWLAGLGRPDQHFTDVVAVYIPPVLAALTVICAYFISKMLKNKWAGLLAAALLAIMPGEFLNRSLLGYTDQHVAEVLWSTLFMLFVLLAVKHGENIDAKYIKQNGWKSVIKPVTLCILAGLALAVYMLTWAGAALFVFVLFVFLVVQAIINFLNSRSTLAMGIIGVMTLISALIMYYPVSRSFFSVLSIVGAIFIVAIMVIMAELMGRYILKKRYYIYSLVGLGVLGIALFYIIAPQLMATLVDRFLGVFGWFPNTTVMEMQPLLLHQGQFTLLVAFANYTSGLFLGLAGLVLMVYSAVRKPDSREILLIVWSIVILMAALAMRRYAYYFAVNIAVLSGYFVWQILTLVGFGSKPAENVTKQPLPRAKAARIREAKAKRSYNRRPVLMSLVLLVVLAVMIYPNTGPLPDGQKPSIDLATRPLFAPSDAWYESLDWMRANTPEPLGDSSSYYGLYKAPGGPGGYAYPDSAYGVLSWWDYGYWVTRIGRRLPFSNPGTGAVRGEAQYFLAQDELSARQILKDVDVRYVIVDSEIASYDGKFHALPTWVNSSYQAYYDLYLNKQDDKYVPVLLFYPEYYRSMVVRLYNFDGREVIPDQVRVIGYQEVVAPEGQRYKAISDVQKFNSYQEAVQFVNSQKTSNYRIIGDSPYKSPVPLEALKNYKLIHSSKQTVTLDSVTMPLIKIYEYQP